MKEYLISKYDPQYRVDGIYVRYDWDGETDIGKVFADGLLTRQKYNAVLDSYVECAMEILDSAHIEWMTVSGLEDYADEAPWKENEAVSGRQLALVISDCMHEKYWCRLVAERAFVHFGYELYMYIGCDLEYDEAAKICARHGLYAVERASPYKESE